MEGSYVGPAFDDARVYDAMRVGVVTCRPETKLADVARMMVGYDIHSVVVAGVQGERRMWGIVTALDLARVPDALGSLTAADVASTDLVTIDSDEPLGRAAKLMAEHQVTHLIAVQPGTDLPAGMVSARGLAAALAYGR
ncbi:MAG: CBS domain-containing protein [Thermoleophilaceae bacterium]